MRQDLTDITLIVDRSGSMTACQVEAQGGINGFIEDQKKKDGEAVFSLLQFDTDYDWVFKSVPIKSATEYKLVPRGMTALLDAVGRAINETGARLDKISENDRPGLVVIAIITDGQENSSHEFKKPTIKDMIERQQNTYNWQFTFLGANQDAFAEAGGLGINLAAAANYDPSKANVAYQSLSMNVGRMRSASFAGQTAKAFYTDEERDNMAKK
jgi:Mg-chelatase subunit ChlD